MNPNEPTIRYYFDITEKTFAEGSGQADWDAGTHEMQEEHPIHFAGATLFVYTQHAADVNIRIDESNDRTTWTPVSFSTPTTTGNLAHNMVPHALAALLFVSSAPYVRFRAVDNAGDPVRNDVFCWLVEWPPVNWEGSALY